MMTASNWVSPYDLADILRLLHSQGVNPIIVGGQAVNLWGLAYHRPGEPAWDDLLPYASMDLDYFGSKVEVFLCEQALRPLGAVAVLSEPFSNSPQSGIVTIQLPEQNRSFRIDILGSVYGLSDGEVASTALVWNGIGPLAGVDLKVLHPLLCLEGKLRNLYTLPQEKRQDLKHLRMSCLCVHAWMEQTLLREGAQSARPLLRAAARLIDLAERDAGLSAWYFHGVIIEQAIAIDAFSQSENPKLAHFLELNWPQLIARLNQRREIYTKLQERG